MLTPPHVARVAVAAAVAVAISLIGSVPGNAEDTPRAKPADSVLDAALAITKGQGVPTVVVFTSPDQPASVRFWTEFYNGPWARSRRGLVQLVNVSKPENAELARLMGIARCPAVVIFTRGPKGVAKLGTITDCDSAEALASWLRVLDTSAGLADKSVTPTLFKGDVYPSQQYSPPSPPPVPVQPQLQEQPQAPPMVTVAPPMVSTSAAVIQMPSQNLMIQQAPPQVFLAPQPAPVVYVPQVATSAPAAPAANLFMAAPSVGTAPAPQPQPTLAASPAPPTLAVAASPAPAAPMATLAVAAGAPTLAVGTQTLSLPSSATRSNVRVRGPGMLQLGLSRLGDRLIQLGRTRIVSTQVTTLEAPRTQAPPGGLTTISSTTTTPVAQQPTTLIMQPEEVCDHTCRPPCQHRRHFPCQHPDTSRTVPSPQDFPN